MSDDAPIDLSRVNADLATALSGQLEWTTPAGTPSNLLTEIVEDTVQILQRLQVVESGLAQLGASLERIDARLDTTTRAISGELSAQRRDLLGERKGLLARSLFNAIIAHLDGLRAMQQGLYDAKGRLDRGNQRTADQLNAIVTTLLTALQGMGFNEFHAKAGEPFSPASMECLGYAKGARGIVLRAVRSGFTATEGVVRPAGVYIAEP